MESLELTWWHATHLLVWFELFTKYLTTKKKIGVSVFQNINALIRHLVTYLSIASQLFLKGFLQQIIPTVMIVKVVVFCCFSFNDIR